VDRLIQWFNHELPIPVDLPWRGCINPKHYALASVWGNIRDFTSFEKDWSSSRSNSYHDDGDASLYPIIIHGRREADHGSKVEGISFREL
jgi:hypothetical protein